MAGCFGNSFFDRAMEQQLNHYLNHMDDVYCENCGWEGDSSNCESTEDDYIVICPECKTEIKL